MNLSSLKSDNKLGDIFSCTWIIIIIIVEVSRNDKEQYNTFERSLHNSWLHYVIRYKNNKL